MKEFAIIFMALLACCTSIAANGRKQSICYNQNGVLVPMRGTCSGFFICVNGNAIASSCGDYFHFNARTGYCDHPERAVCLEPQAPHATELELVEPQHIMEHGTYLTVAPMLPTVTTVAPSSPDQAIPRPQHPDEVVADLDAGYICHKQRNGVQLPRAGPHRCTQFYVCIMQKPYRRTCTEHKQFSVAHAKCVVPALTQCNEQELELEAEEAVEQEQKQQDQDQIQPYPTPILSIETSLPPPTPRPISNTPPQYVSSLSCTGVAPGSLQPHATDCGKFLSCSSGGRAFEMRCPPGLHFSASQRHCDWPINAKCIETYLE